MCMHWCQRGKGWLWRYVRSSMTYPLLLPPLCDPCDGHYLIDGVFVNVLPGSLLSSLIPILILPSPLLPLPSLPLGGAEMRSLVEHLGEWVIKPHKILFLSSQLACCRLSIWAYFVFPLPFDSLDICCHIDLSIYASANAIRLTMALRTSQYVSVGLHAAAVRSGGWQLPPWWRLRQQCARWVVAVPPVLFSFIHLHFPCSDSCMLIFFFAFCPFGTNINCTNLFSCLAGVFHGVCINFYSFFGLNFVVCFYRTPALSGWSKSCFTYSITYIRNTFLKRIRFWNKVVPSL